MNQESNPCDDQQEQSCQRIDLKAYLQLQITNVNPTPERLLNCCCAPTPQGDTSPDRLTQCSQYSQWSNQGCEGSAQSTTQQQIEDKTQQREKRNQPELRCHEALRQRKDCLG